MNAGHKNVSLVTPSQAESQEAGPCIIRGLSICRSAGPRSWNSFGGHQKHTDSFPWNFRGVRRNAIRSVTHCFELSKICALKNPYASTAEPPHPGVSHVPVQPSSGERSPALLGSSEVLLTVAAVFLSSWRCTAAADLLCTAMGPGSRLI